MRIRAGFSGLAIAGFLFAGSASATPADNEWAGWAGCWRAEAAAAGDLLCVVPEGGSVRLVNVADGKVTGESRLHADGASRPVSEGGCEGTEVTQWSADGQRVFTRVELTCGTSIPRRVSSIYSMLSPREWVNVQSIGAGDQATARTIRYTLVDPSEAPAEIAAALATPHMLARETIRQAATAALDIEDLREALRLVDARAVEALLLVRNQSFNVDAKTLVALHRDGIASTVIDALVAVSHPERFAIVNELEPLNVANLASAEFRPVGGMAGMNLARMCSAWDRGFSTGLDSFYADDLCYGSSYLSYLGMSRYGSSRYGYSQPWGYRPIIVIRNPGTDPNLEGQQKPSVTRNGYRGGSDRTGTARPRTNTTPANWTGDASRSTGTTSGSATGNSSNGSSSDTGRTARPRTGG